MPEYPARLGYGRRDRLHPQQNARSNAMTDQARSASGDKLRDDVRRAVEAGKDVQDQVRRITIQALTGGGFDKEAMRHVADAVSHGVQLGAAAHGAQARAAIEQAISGLDEAFAKSAQASTLALKEFSGKAQAFAARDLQRALDDIKALEGLYLDSLRNAAKGGRDFASEAMRAIAEHAAASGTAVGRQIKASVDELGTTLGHSAQAQWQSGVESGIAMGVLFARAASGFLAGIAERLENPPPKPDGDKKKP
jgi:hypothetical protein